MRAHSVSVEDRAHSDNRPTSKTFNGSRLCGLLLCSLLLGASLFSAAAAEDSGAAPVGDVALRALTDRYPGVQTLTLADRRAVFGKPMTTAPTPEAAAQRFLAAHDSIFGVDPVNLQLRRTYDLRSNGLVAFHYEQHVGEAIVEFGAARVLVLKREHDAVVVYAAATLAHVTEAELPPIVLTPDQATAVVQNSRLFRGLDNYTVPELSIVKNTASNAEVATPRRTWRLLGWNESLENPKAFMFHVDAETGQMLEARSEIHQVDVTGNVSGLATPGDLPDTATNTPVTTPVPNTNVSIGGTVAVSDDAGAFTVPNAGTTAVTVDAGLSGPWVNIIAQQGTAVSGSVGATPPGPVSLLLNNTPTEFTTSQINAFIHCNLVHDFFEDRAPAFNDIDITLPVNVNVNGTCNANFSSGSMSLNFFASGNGCTNSAFSDVIQHEYGHFVVNRLGLGQGAFGEGFGDTLSLIFSDDPLLGQDFFGPGQVGRDVVGDNVQYPCPGSGIHFCGELLSGCWWDLRLNLGNTMGSAPGRDAAQQMFADWSQLTLGGMGLDSAHPLTAIEYLMIDDNDGDLDNGTPNRTEICAAFASHSIDCPVLPAIGFEFPQALATLVSPSQSTQVQVSIFDLNETVAPGSERFWYSFNGGPFIQTTPNSLGSDLFEGVLPATGECGRYRYYFTADVVGGGTESSTPIATPHTAAVGDSIVELLADNLETDLGWVVGDPTDTATTGVWTRDDPIGTAAQTDTDNSPVGSQCWFTGQGTVGGALGQNDVDNGATTLTTPNIDATLGETRIEFYLWYSNSAGAAPASDVFQIEISNSGLAGPWVSARVIGPSGDEVLGGWRFHELWVTDHVPATSNVRLRFRARDDSPGSIVEAAIDDLRIEYVFCDPAPKFVRGDCNDDLGIQIADAVFLLTALFSGTGTDPVCPDACDSNDDGSVNIGDAVLILSALFSGGGPLPEPTSCGPDPTDQDTLTTCNGAACP